MSAVAQLNDGHVSPDYVKRLGRGFAELAALARRATGPDASANATALEALAEHLRVLAWRTDVPASAANRYPGQRQDEGDPSIRDWQLWSLRMVWQGQPGVRLAKVLRELGTRQGAYGTAAEMLAEMLSAAMLDRVNASERGLGAANAARAQAEQAAFDAVARLRDAEERAAHAESQLGRAVAVGQQLEAELAEARESIAFLRSLLDTDGGGSAGNPGAAKPSDVKRRIERGVYARDRADGTTAFQVVGTSSRPGATFDSLDQAVAYRNGTDPAEPRTTRQDAGPSADSAGSADGMRVTS